MIILGRQPAVIIPYSTTTLPYTVTTADQVLLISGTSGTITIYTAIGNKGKQIQLIHGGTSLTQIYTINTTSAQTIGGIASGSFVLYTTTERLSIISDGANWQILEHMATASGTYTPAFGVGFGTVTTNTGNWFREGKWISLNNYWTCGTVTAAAATVTLPGSITIDTSAGFCSRNNTSANPGQIWGTFGGSNGADAGHMISSPSTSTTLLYFTDNFGAASSMITSATADTFSATSAQMGLWCKIPITEFQP